jgi:spore maturation protein CgeB
MRILYIGTLIGWGTSLSRMKGLIRLGHDVIPLDIESYISQQGRLLAIIHRKLLLGPGISGLNKKAIQLSAQCRPDIVWVDKGIYLYPKTITQIKRTTEAVLVHHNTDDIQAAHHNFKYYLNARDRYDAHYSSNLYNVDEMRILTSAHIEYNEIGYDDEQFKPMELTVDDRKKYHSELFFIGHWEKNTEKYIRALIDAELPVSVRGPGWPELDGKRLPRGIVKGGPVFEQEYVKALNAGKIGLGIVSVLNRNKTAGRTFEIPACGTMMLAVRNDVLTSLYTEGIEAAFFSSPQELLEKARYYLHHDQERKAIGEAGRKRVIANKCSWKDRVEEILVDLKKIGFVS